MEAVKLLIVFLVLVLLQVMGAFSGPLSNEEQDAGIWSLDTWQDPLERGLSMRLAEIIKRSKAQQFHGLMGRSSGYVLPTEASHSARLGRKSEYANEQSANKYEKFVGLMGRRNLGEESEKEWDMY
ncbi:hypothetical protein WMY93_003523 [Mugilogobius chulae]|uniref:Uncharacterized protein n=1 Tax=Mugilogobius chulae TaxID=88201 RepID=A0AAW0Q7K6_9GOBI